MGKIKHERQKNRSERVDVRKRVQRQPPEIAGRVVSQSVGDRAVGDFVQGNGEKKRNSHRRDLESCFGKVRHA